MNESFEEKKQKIENSGLYRDSLKLRPLEETIRYNKILDKRRLFKGLKFIFYIFMLIPIASYLFENIFGILSFKSLMFFAIGFLVIYLIEFFITGIIKYNVLKTKYKNMINQEPKLKYAFYNDGIIINDENSVSAFYYSEFKNIEKLENDVYNFYLNPKHHFLLVKESDDEEHTIKFNAFIDHLYECNYIKTDYINYKNNRLLGYLLIALLFVVSIFIFCNIYYHLYLSVSYAFFMLRMYIIIYSYYINRLNIKSALVFIGLSLLAVILGYYIFYVLYYSNYYQNYSFLQLFINLFSIIKGSELVEGTALKTLLLDIVVVFGLCFVFNSIYIVYLIKDNKKDNNVQTVVYENMHLSKKIKNILFYILTLLIMIANISRITLFNAFTDFITGNVFKGYAGKDLVSLVLRYEDSLMKLKEVNNEAYDEAYDILLMQSSNIYSDFNVNEYFIDSSGHEYNDVITVYCSSDFDGQDLFYELYDYGTESSGEWSDWYGNGDETDYIDLEVNVKGDGFCIVKFSSSLDSRTISVFIDNTVKNNNNQRINTIYIENYWFLRIFIIRFFRK